MKEEKSDRNFLRFYLSCKTIIPFVFPPPCFVSLLWFISGDFTEEEEIGLKGPRRDNRLKTVLNRLLTTVELLSPIRFVFPQALNAALFYNNPDPRTYVSLVPTSAHTGDGMGDLISQVVRLTQTKLAQRLSFSEELESMVLEVRT